LSYAALQAATAIADVRELENLIISCIYAGVLSGKVRLFFVFFLCVLFAQTLCNTQLDQAQQALWCVVARAAMFDRLNWNRYARVYVRLGKTLEHFCLTSLNCSRGWRSQADAVLGSLAQQQKFISERVQERRRDADRREKEIVDKKERVQAELIVEQKEGGARTATAATSFSWTTILPRALVVHGGGDKRRARTVRSSRAVRSSCTTRTWQYYHSH
jgi:hypothetical protein